MSVQSSITACRNAAREADRMMSTADDLARDTERARRFVTAAAASGHFAEASQALAECRRLAERCRVAAIDARESALDCHDHAAVVIQARGVVRGDIAVGQWTRRASHAANMADDRREEANRALTHAELDWTTACRIAERDAPGLLPG